MDESHFSEDFCVICKKRFEEEKPVVVSRKGALTLVRFSEKHGRLELADYLTHLMNTTPTKAILVHKTCRRDFTDAKRMHLNEEEDVTVQCAKRLRSRLVPFDWKKDCMLCGKSAEADARHPERQVHKVATIPLREKVLECCRKRGDAWGYEVQDRLHGCIDLVAAEAVYPNSCFSRFMLSKQLDGATAKRSRGRPEDQQMGQYFKELCQWLDLEAGSELYTIAELHAKMVEFSGEGDDEVYKAKTKTAGTLW